MVICEAADTDKKTAGLLDKMLKTIDLAPADICIKSTLTDDIRQQIPTKSPQLVLVLGRTATQFLLNWRQQMYQKNVRIQLIPVFIDRPGTR